MSHFIHREPFKEPLRRDRTGLIQLGFILLGSLVLLFLFIPFSARAQESCGDIITEYDGQDERTLIEQCNDPFAVSQANFDWGIAITLDGTSLQEGEVREVESLPVGLELEAEIPAQPYYGFYSVVYRHEGNDYRQLGGFEFGEEPWLLNATGTYSVVSTLDFNFPTQSLNRWQKLIALVIATAHAQEIEYTGYARSVVTFTLDVAEIVPEPTGASSVLFLPGIQASRLYKEGLVGEDQLWEPNRNEDVSQLAMTEDGQSVEDIYTRDVIDEVFGVSNIYQSFLNMMEEMVAEEKIKAFTPFAYDWRYSARDVVENGVKYEEGVKYAAAEIERLSGNNSFTGKVTLIAHSNGGLLVKSLLTEYPELANHVDKVVFIGTPHLGTPKAIATVLHGYDQQAVGGLLIDDVTVRDVINNMPGAYGLLPSRKYLSQSDIPVVYFKDGVVTEAMRLQYGTSINTEGEYIDFLNGVEGRANQSDDISTPYTTNPVLLEGALNEHVVLDEWVAPEGIQVFNLVGVGLKTISALEYREVTEASCTDTVFGGISCTTDRFVRPYAHFTPYGDETVAALSAENVDADRYYFDFEKFRNENLGLSRNDHADFLEVEEVQNFIQNIINSTSSQIEYVSLDRPTLNEEYEVVSVDSPVRIVAVDADGRSAGVIEEEGQLKVVEGIPNSQYFEFAGTKYLITPKSINVTFRLFGQAYGGFTLTVTSLKGDREEVLSELSNASTTPGMVATFSREGNTYSTISTDVDGDGQIDLETTLTGDVVSNEEPVSFDLLKSEIKNLGLANNKKKALLIVVDLAEGFTQKSTVRPLFAKLAKESLLNLSKLVDLYKRKGWITEAEATSLQRIITGLRDSI